MNKKICIIIVSVIVLFSLLISGLYLLIKKSTVKGSCIYIDENNIVQYINLEDKTHHKICSSDFVYHGETYRFESFSKTDECDFCGFASNNDKKMIVYFKDGKYYATECDNTIKQGGFTYNGNTAYLENGILYIKSDSTKKIEIAEATEIYGWVSEYLLFKNEKMYCVYHDGKTQKLSDKILLIVGESDANSAIICRWKSSVGAETNYATCFYSLKYRTKISYPFEVYFPLGLEPAKVYWSSSDNLKEYENIDLNFS